MECPNECGNTTNFNVATRLLCLTALSFEDGKLVTDETKTRETWTNVEPEFVECGKCQYSGKPEEFGLYSGKLLKTKLERLIHKALESDTLGALPNQLMSIVLPQGGILIHKGGTPE